jgi:uncharacterized protein
MSAPADERSSPFSATERSRVRRKAERGAYDRDIVYAILDEALFCHVGFVVSGQPFVIPTIHARVVDDLLLHGAAANHMLKSLAARIDACVTVTILDGLVMARSWFHHSMNYRSVVLFGRAARVGDEAEKRAGLEAVVEHVARGRAADSRPPTPTELRSTLLLRMPIVEASAKVRAGGPIDDDEDMGTHHWAGVVPLTLTAGPPAPDAMLSAAAIAPDYVAHWSRPSR